MEIITIDSRQDHLVKFSNDLFFKYMLSREHHDSKALLKQIIYLILGIECKTTRVKNPAILPSDLNDKCIVLDVYVENEDGTQIDIELQMYGNDMSENIRFQYYEAMMLVDQVTSGIGYQHISQVYQCILTNLYNDDTMWKLGRERELSKLREDYFKHVCREEGLEEGIHQALMTSCKLIISNLFHTSDLPWLQTLSKEQLEALQTLAFQEKDFENLKRKVDLMTEKE